ncbi:hypothetical protein ACFSL4_13455 [Streptomyces caeni]|uniref:Uncharacterized protein n=1 Tax=Streptomyces caeni TaxID=2307231 RepID=A0ABW4IR32_9ACTN
MAASSERRTMLCFLAVDRFLRSAKPGRFHRAGGLAGAGPGGPHGGGVLHLVRGQDLAGSRAA